MCESRTHIDFQHEKQALSESPLRVDPFLHYEEGAVHSPTTDVTLNEGGSGYSELLALSEGRLTVEALNEKTRGDLAKQGFLSRGDDHQLSKRFYLKYVSLEAHTVCNQACYFCPVSLHPRDAHFMSDAFYEDILKQLEPYRDTIDGVSMINYNEPTVDKRFLDQVRLIKEYGLPPAVLTNGTGLTPKRVDAIVEMGGLRYLSINISTLDRERYSKDRKGDHIPLVMKNLQHMRDLPVATDMDMAVLGSGDAEHKRDFEQIQKEFEGSRFNVQYYEVMDRAGNVPVGHKPPDRNAPLCGCDQTGSRAIQWVHITPHGKCVLCCQDYHEYYEIGDLNEQSLEEILTGDKMALFRRWVYGLEEAPDDFICRDCVYALRRDAVRSEEVA